MSFTEDLDATKASGRGCKFGHWLDTLEDDYRDEIVPYLADTSYDSVWLSRAFKREGWDGSNDTFRHHRKGNCTCRS